MQIDFHFYAIAVLARAAGFEAEEALIIGYASQYVDNATESELIRLDINGSDIKFDPVRSSYDGLAVVSSIQWSAQKRVWIPFHFLPPEPFQPETSATFSFVTEPNSTFGRMLLDAAAQAKARKHRLCATGIAMHTFADSWAHQQFSGRQNRYENDVETIQVYKNRKFETLGMENVLFDILPQIGHAEAGYFADLTYARWRYQAASQKKTVTRNNLTEFMEAAETIYTWFRNHTSNPPVLKWEEELKPEIKKLLANGPQKEPGIEDRLTIPLYKVHQQQDLEGRCDFWRRTFGTLFKPVQHKYFYDQQEWRKDALIGETDWDNFSSRDWDLEGPFKGKPGFWNSLWVHFHRAALRQRHLVLENLP